MVDMGAIAKWSAEWDNDREAQIIGDAAWSVNLRAPLMRQSVLSRAQPHVFSHSVTPMMRATNQQHTGRCWAFAGLNLMRRHIMVKHGIRNSDFELSQAFFMFYDKLEKAYYFLTNVERTRDQLSTSRLVHFLFHDPIPDGGEWGMFVNIVRKYGVVPKACMQESSSSSASRQMNKLLKELLRQQARVIRSGARYDIDDMMRRVYRLLCIAIGVPPSRFDWTYEVKKTKKKEKKTQSRTRADEPSDDDDSSSSSTSGNDSDSDDLNTASRVHEVDDDDFRSHASSSSRSPDVASTTMTPMQLYADCEELELEKMVVLVDVPTKEFGTYVVDFLGNMSDVAPTRFHNVHNYDLAKAAYRSIARNRPVWFGCEFTMRHMSKGLLHHRLMDYSRAFGGEHATDKKTRLEAMCVEVNHAMLLCGFHKDGTSLVRWQVENSHGSKGVGKGFLSMSHGWFETYVYSIVVHPDDVPDDVRAHLARAPEAQHIDPWDVLGNLARLA